MKTFRLVEMDETALAVIQGGQKLTTAELILAGANEHCLNTGLRFHHTRRVTQKDPQP